MKMEVIGWHELLTVYIKQQYAGKSVLVVFQDDAEDPDEYEALLRDLDAMGFAPPYRFRGGGYLIVEMDDFTAKELISDHKTNNIRMELFADGECIIENY